MTTDPYHARLERESSLPRALILALIGLLLLLAAAALDAQTLPDAPQPAIASAIPVSQADYYHDAIEAHEHEQRRAQWLTNYLPLIADSSARGLDTWTTLRKTHDCSPPDAHGWYACPSDTLPRSIAASPLRMTLFSAGMTGTLWLASHKLRRFHHPKLGAALEYGDAAIDGQAAIRNLWVSKPAIPPISLTVLPKKH